MERRQEHHQVISETRKLLTESQNSKLETRKPQTQNRDQTPEARNPKTRNMKHEIRN